MGFLEETVEGGAKPGVRDSFSRAANFNSEVRSPGLKSPSRIMRAVFRKRLRQAFAPLDYAIGIIG